MRSKKSTLSDRIIVSNNKPNNFYCERCCKSHNVLIIFKGERYCMDCFAGKVDKLNKYNQEGELLDGATED